MSPQRSTVTDQQSEKHRRTVGRPPASRAAMLEAASTVFASATVPHAVTMEAVAAAAGVGKGTVFRAFGDRDGLLDAVVEAQFSALRSAVDDGAGPFADDVEPARRIAAFLDGVLDFKLDNHNLMRAREIASTTTNLSSNRFRWMHDVLAKWITEASPESSIEPSYAAHALLLLLQIDVVDQLLAGGLSIEELKRQQARHVHVLLE